MRTPAFIALAIITGENCLAQELDPVIYDPTNPALPYLQTPGEALPLLPRQPFGDGVDWSAALELGILSPRAEVDRPGSMTVLDLDIVMPQTGELAPVVFGHETHTEWLGCGSCHPAVAMPIAGANGIDMDEIVAGGACGTCHGTTAFPLADCQRCHREPP